MSLDHDVDELYDGETAMLQRLRKVLRLPLRNTARPNARSNHLPSAASPKKCGTPYARPGTPLEDSALIPLPGYSPASALQK